MSTTLTPGSEWVAKGGGVQKYIVLGTVQDGEVTHVVYKAYGSRYVSSKADFVSMFEPKPKPQIVDVQTYDPWPFKEERIETTLHYIGSRGLRDPESKFGNDGWALVKDIDNIIVTFDDGVQAVTTSYYLANYQEQNS